MMLSSPLIVSPNLIWDNGWHQGMFQESVYPPDGLLWLKSSCFIFGRGATFLSKDNPPNQPLRDEKIIFQDGLQYFDSALDRFTLKGDDKASTLLLFLLGQSHSRQFLATHLTLAICLYTSCVEYCRC